MSPIIILPSERDPTYEEEVAADSPLAWWKLQETSGVTAVDSIGGANLTYLNSPLLNQTGPFGSSKSVDFDGSTQHAAAAVIPFGSGNITERTVEFWMAPDTYSPAQNTVLVKQDNNDGTVSNGSNLSSFLDPSGQMNHDEFLPSGAQLTSSALSGSPGDWFHVVMVKSTTPPVREIWINGVLDASDASPETYGGPFGGGGPVSHTSIGAGSFAGQFFDGKIAYMTFWASRLDSTRIQAHYQAAVTEGLN